MNLHSSIFSISVPLIIELATIHDAKSCINIQLTKVRELLVLFGLSLWFRLLDWLWWCLDDFFLGNKFKFRWSFSHGLLLFVSELVELLRSLLLLFLTNLFFWFVDFFLGIRL